MSFYALKVSIRACEESRVLLWHRDKLKLILLTDPFLQAVFDHILGRDVVHKLVQVTTRFSAPSPVSFPLYLLELLKQLNESVLV